MSEIQVTQIRPLSNCVAPIWLYPSSDKPDEIKVPMEDGSVETYIRLVQQPHPLCLKAAELCRKMSNELNGYRPKHGKGDGSL
jgi:hypothetical protein